jgi:hypothetical protein
MPNSKWLDRYDEQNTNELLALETEYNVASVVLAFEQALGQKSAREGQGSLSTHERVVLAIEALEREVNNGGYSQFFLNSSREYAPIIVDCLNQIGCPRTAVNTKRAIAALHLPEVSEGAIQVEMEEQNDRRDKQLDECDKTYFSEPERIVERLFAYIKVHRNSFRLR